MTMDDIIDSFNNGELDAEGYFNDYDTFFNILKKRGLMSQVNPDAPDSEEWQNEYLIWLYSNDKEKFDTYIEKFLGDVEIVNGIPYLILNSQGELSKLFCTHRNELTPDTIESILDGEHDNYYYDYSTDDVYRDVIEELTKEEKRLLVYLENVKHAQIIILENKSIKHIVSDLKKEEKRLELEIENTRKLLKAQTYVLENTIFNNDILSSEKPLSEKPLSEKPLSEKPLSEKNNKTSFAHKVAYGNN